MLTFLHSISILELVVGFGFVVFWHELGHFLAAKYVGIKVDQFAVGFGQAIFSWRPGLGFTMGTSAPIVAAMKERGEDVSGIGETEYRLNWIPLGGYVKMLGQDDMNPTAGSSDPRSFNRKSIGARMLVVSAGVIMNVILAFVLFVGLFLYGLRSMPPVVGSVMVNSPAQIAGVRPGDKVISIDGSATTDFMKIQLATALASPDGVMNVVVEHADGKQEMVQIHPMRDDTDHMLRVGITPGVELAGVDQKDLQEAQEMGDLDEPVDYGSKIEIMPGDLVTWVGLAGEDAAKGQGYTVERREGVDPASAEAVDERRRNLAGVDAVLQRSGGGNVIVMVKNPLRNGGAATLTMAVAFEDSMDGKQFNLAGLQPRPVVTGSKKESDAHDKLVKGDIIVGIKIGKYGDVTMHPGYEGFVNAVQKAPNASTLIGVEYLRDGKADWVEDLKPHVDLGEGKKPGLGLSFGRFDLEHPITAENVEDSSASAANVPAGSTIVSIDGAAVSDWYQIYDAMMAAAKAHKNGVMVGYVPDEAGIGTPVPTTAPAVAVAAGAAAGGVGGGTTKPATLVFSQADRDYLLNARYVIRDHADFATTFLPRKTKNPLTAMSWGFVETKDLLLQFYVTLQRLAQGSVPAKGLAGPVGMFNAGKQFSERGMDYLLWFLAMISANLAVVNFLPIPIVDGGLFAFLVLEKIQGKPLSPRGQWVAQVVGLAMILTVFVFVTYQDIHRMLGNG